MSATVMDLVVVFALFVFMLAQLCFCVAAVFPANKDLYIAGHETDARGRRTERKQLLRP